MISIKDGKFQRNCSRLYSRQEIVVCRVYRAHKDTAVEALGRFNTLCWPTVLTSGYHPFKRL